MMFFTRPGSVLDRDVTRARSNEEYLECGYNMRAGRSATETYMKIQRIQKTKELRNWFS
ncbi:hypothetical protein KGM_213529 [Danaus plexippus plexippus]|uniref:Uncharacterized protein n=1 Tax=Danaus plexippus plexippus TaxID=278856 RepID=A0A212ENU6_DANPL|nr:hypothetical protein KGM_213529 [Danaus plexippus plexippus]